MTTVHILMLAKQGEEDKVLKEGSKLNLYVYGAQGQDQQPTKDAAHAAYNKTDLPKIYTVLASADVPRLLAVRIAVDNTRELVWPIFEAARKEGTVIESGTSVPVKGVKVKTPWAKELEMLKAVNCDDAMALVRSMCGSTKGEKR